MFIIIDIIQCKKNKQKKPNNNILYKNELVSGDLGKTKPYETRRHWRLAPGLCLNFKTSVCVCVCVCVCGLLSVLESLPEYQGILCAAFRTPWVSSFHL